MYGSQLLIRKSGKSLTRYFVFLIKSLKFEFIRLFYTLPYMQFAFLSLSRNGQLRSWLRTRRQSKFEALALSKRDRSRAKFVAVTGSSGKSTTTALISHILAQNHKVRPQVLDNLYNGLLGTLAALEPDDEFVVAEAAVAKPGDMTPQANALKPDVSVVTMLGLEHRVTFKSVENIASEKSQLVAMTKSSGTAVLNLDDPLVWAMRELARCRVVSFGMSINADYQVLDVDYCFGGYLLITMKICGRIHSFEVPLNGRHFWVSLAAAISATHELGIGLDEIAKSLLSFKPIFGRCLTYRPKNGPVFILDTAKAPYYSLHHFFKLIEVGETGKTIVIIGQISDYGGKNNSIYSEVYRAVKNVADIVIYVGEHCERSGASNDEISQGKFKSFKHVIDACNFVKSVANADDRIYIKSSQNLHLERIAMFYDHVVRCDQDVCGSPINCQKCGLIEFPPATHLEEKYKRGEFRRPRLNSFKRIFRA